MYNVGTMHPHSSQSMYMHTKIHMVISICTIYMYMHAYVHVQCTCSVFLGWGNSPLLLGVVPKGEVYAGGLAAYELEVRGTGENLLQWLAIGTERKGPTLTGVLPYQAGGRGGGRVGGGGREGRREGGQMNG